MRIFKETLNRETVHKTGGDTYMQHTAACVCVCVQGFVWQPKQNTTVAVHVRGDEGINKFQLLNFCC